MTQYFLVPFRRNRRFVGREAQLAQLHQQLQDHRTTGIIGLSGMGGIGKTQLAVEYVYRARERGHYPDGIFWLNAARPLRGEFAALGQTLQARQAQADQPPLDLEEALATAFNAEEIRDLIMEMDLPQHELPSEDALLIEGLIGYCERRGRSTQLAEEILRQRPHLRPRAVAYQEQSQEEQVGQAVAYWQAQPHSLIVLDNLEDLTRLEQRLYRDLIPADLPCRLLFTSRQTYTGQWHNLNLNVLPEAAALELLLGDPRHQPILARPNSDEYEAARSICDILGRLPLAVEKAAVHLQNHFPIPIARYRDELLERGALPVLDDPRGGQVVTLDERHRAGLAATLQSQWDNLAKTAAKEVLKVAGQLPEAAIIPIPRLGLLAGLPREGESFFDVTIGQAVQALLDVSLMERLQEGQVRLHPLVREFAQSQTNNPDQFRRLCAGRLIDAYEDFAILEDHCIRRGIVALQEDLRTALDLISRSEATKATQYYRTTTQTLLSLLQSEAQALQDWQPRHYPNFFLQQVAKWAIELGLISLWHEAETLLVKKQPPYWRVNWTTKHVSPALKYTLSGHRSEVLTVAITPDGTKAISGSADSTARLWDLQSGTQERIVGMHYANVRAVAITPDGKKAITVSFGSFVRVWNLETGEDQTLSGHDWVHAVAVTPDGKKAISASVSSIKLWDLQSGKEVRTHSEEEFDINAVTITPDGQKVVFICSNNNVKVWDLQSGEIEQILFAHKDWGTLMAFALDSQKAICGSSHKTLNVWDLRSAKKELSLPDRNDRESVVTITPDGQKVIYTSTKNDLKVWDLSCKEELTLFGHSGLVRAIAITPDGQTAISASHDKAIKVWDISAFYNTRLQTGQLERTASGHESSIKTVTINPDGQKAVSVSADHTLKIWDLQTGQIEQTLFSNSEAANAVAVTPDGYKAISVFADHTVKIWNLDSGTEEKTLPNHNREINALTITPNGQKAISVSFNTIELWNLQTGEIQYSKHESALINAVAVTLDSRKAVYAFQNSLNVWDLQTGGVESILSDQTYIRIQEEKAVDYNLYQYTITATAVTPDGQKVITASQDHVIRVWNLQGVLERTLSGHTDWINAVAVTADGYRAVSASDDRSLKVWNLLSGQEIVSITLDESLYCVAIAPDDKTIVTGDGRGNIYCLRLVLGEDNNELGK